MVKDLDSDRAGRRGRLVVQCGIVVAALALGCGGSSGYGSNSGGQTPMQPQANSQAAAVSMLGSGGYGSSFSFSPVTINVSVGDTVVWQNQTGAVHTVTADDGAWDSGDVSGNGTYRRVFDAAGTYPYHCRYHGAPGGQGMAGTVVVQ